MQPWVIDAFNIPINEVDAFDNALLHRTPAIERFLSDENRQTHVIVGPKGFGKTLLIRAKRLKLTRDGITNLPRNTPVDRPFGHTPILSLDQVRHILGERSYWFNLWLCAFIVCIIKEHVTADDAERRLKCSEVRRCLIANDIRSPSDMFKIFLRLLPAEYFRLIDDIDELTPRFRAIHSSTCLFLDNVDEFFDIHLPSGRETSGAVHGVRRRDFWYNAQIGAIDAARELSRINAHVRVYCSVRKEALEEAIRHDPQALQVRGGCLELEYSDTDLKSILVKNIDAESPELLAVPGARDPFERWVGKECMELEHATTGEIENIAAYIIRHSLRRPRDVIYLGLAISQVAPKDRSPAKIKEVVNAAAANVARDYLNECTPHLTGFDQDVLLPLIETNVLSKEDIDAITIKYTDVYSSKRPDAEDDVYDVFSTLFRIGLLGVVARSILDPRQRVQLFRFPGGPARVERERLPVADHYLIHPVLSDLIAARFSSDYVRSCNRMNIIAPDRHWRADSEGCFLAQGDLVGFSAIMESEAGYAPFLDRFHKTVRSCGRELQLCEVSEGDGFVFADQNSRKLIEAVRRIILDLRGFETPREVRIGADYGVLALRKGRASKGLPAIGMPLQVAARVRALAEPGGMWITDDFRNRLISGENSIPPLRKLGEFNISKDTEAPKSRLLWELSIEDPKIDSATADSAIHQPSARKHLRQATPNGTATGPDAGQTPRRKSTRRSAQ